MIFSRFFKKHNKQNDYIEKAAAEEAKKTAVSAEAAESTDIPCDELAAVITAALQSYYSSGTQCKLVIKSIKRTGITSPIWNKTGRLERLSGRI